MRDKIFPSSAQSPLPNIKVLTHMKCKHTLKTICQGTSAYMIHLGLLRSTLLKERAMPEATVWLLFYYSK